MRRYALLVGVNGYLDQKIPSLDFAEQDVAEISRLLQERCGFKTRCLAGAEATRENIGEVLTHGRLHKGGERMKSKDQFLFFFAGHGELVGGSYILHPYDAQFGRSWWPGRSRSRHQRYWSGCRASQGCKWILAGLPMG